MTHETRPIGAELAAAMIRALGLPSGITKMALRFDGTLPPVVEIEYMPDQERLAEAATDAVVGLMVGRFELREVSA
jgi:hypothetical protein